MHNAYPLNSAKEKSLTMKGLIDRWRNRKRYPFAEMPAWLLVYIGGSAFIVAGYVGLALHDLVPAWMSTVRKVGYFDAIATVSGLFLLYCGAVLWFFSSIAARCHSVLYDRWFK